MRYRINNQDKVRVAWDCPICGSKGGYGGPNQDVICGLCVPACDDETKCLCMSCGWYGAVEDAEITSMEITAVRLNAV